MDEVCVWCGEDVGHEPDCPQVAMDAMQQHIEELTEERDSLSSKLETSQVALKGAEERAKMLLDAKSHWAERARTAESRLDQVRDLLAHIVVKCHETDESLSTLEAPDVRRLDEAYRIAKGRLSNLGQTSSELVVERHVTNEETSASRR